MGHDKQWTKYGSLWVYEVEAGSSRLHTTLAVVLTEDHADGTVTYIGDASPVQGGKSIWLKGYTDLEELKQVIETTVELLG